MPRDLCLQEYIVGTMFDTFVSCRLRVRDFRLPFYHALCRLNSYSHRTNEHTMKLCDRIIEHYFGSDQRYQKPNWFYAWEIDYGDDFLNNATYGEIHGTK
jgi:hypothetical protein